MKYCFKRYKKLGYPCDFACALQHEPQKIADVCNGVGSEVGVLGRLTYHLIPNTILFLDITPASDVHDWMYTYPQQFQTTLEALEYKHLADEMFYRNVLAVIDGNSNWLMRQLRRPRAYSYYKILRGCGAESFLEDKSILCE